ncbi:VasL domain-containing protein [Escherichia marmotae]|uniref:VasL domain-containing protein n=1 Tax=Escherichia marmotae TaxID=1499973 RepID=UPI0020014EC6|nr:VasL domain-containing protein [Escherichia marmotae]
MDKKFILDLTVNTTDPKNNKEFLWLSYSINNLASVKYERSYWMTLEKRCLSLFRENGYDLQTGAWFCLISAHLYSWEGLAISSWKFADSFVKQKKCWPQVTATQMRINILVWYIKNVIPAIQTLPDDEKNHTSLTLLEYALTLLTELEYNLLSGKCFIISDVLTELRRQKNDDSESFDSEVSDAEKSQPSSGRLSPHVDSNDITGQKHNTVINNPKRTRIYYNVISFISGVLITICINYSGKPETALKLRSIIPDSFLTEMVMNYSGCSEFTPDSTDSWSQLNKKIDDFTETLNTIEDNGGYITISKLKTIAYDMKNTFLEYAPPLNVRISKLYNSVNMSKEDVSRELEIIQYNINKFNCEISDLKMKNELLNDKLITK